jgi:hypothetical protein
VESGDDLTMRLFNFDRDYGIIKAWWELHGSSVPKREHLPTTGIVIEVSGKPVSAGFLYRTDSRICVFEFVVVDPEASREDRDIALDLLIEAAMYWAKQEGYTLIYNSSGIQRFIARLEGKGFIKADTGQTHMFREVAQCQNSSADSSVVASLK